MPDYFPLELLGYMVAAALLTLCVTTVLSEFRSNPYTVDDDEIDNIYAEIERSAKGGAE